MRMASPVLSEDPITRVKLLSVLGNLPSMQFSKSSFSIAMRCRKSHLMHGVLQATAFSAVFTLFHFFFLSLFLFFHLFLSLLAQQEEKNGPSAWHLP